MSSKTAVLIWLAVVDLAEASTAYEIAAIQNVGGLHTISHWANVHQLLGWAIFMAILGVAGWWWHHFHEPHPQ